MGCGGAPVLGVQGGGPCRAGEGPRVNMKGGLVGHFACVSRAEPPGEAL